MHLNDRQMKTNAKHKLMELTEKEKLERAGEETWVGQSRERKRRKNYYNVFMPPKDPWGKSTLGSQKRKNDLFVTTRALSAKLLLLSTKLRNQLTFVIVCPRARCKSKSGEHKTATLFQSYLLASLFLACIPVRSLVILCSWLLSTFQASHRP